MSSQCDQLLDLFRRNGNRLTLSQLLHTTLAAEYRARMTDLRHKGYVIKCEKGCSPSANLYTLVEPDTTGQFQMFPQEQKVRYH